MSESAVRDLKTEAMATTMGGEDAMALDAVLAFVDDFSVSDADALASPREPFASHCGGNDNDDELLVELLLPLDERDPSDAMVPFEQQPPNAVEDDGGLWSEVSTSNSDAGSPLGACALVVAPSFSPSSPLQRQQQDRQLVSAAKRMRTKKKRALTSNPNKARDERRDELIYLRNKVVELTEKLDAMKAEKSNSINDDGEELLDEGDQYATASEDGQTMVSLSHSQRRPHQKLHRAVCGVWEDIARRQSEARARAERENIRLRLVLEDQLKVAKSWERMLHRRAATQDLARCIDGAQLHHKYVTTIERSDVEIFEDLLAGIDRAYTEVDAVLEAAGLAHVETPFNDARIFSVGSRGNMSLEICSSKLLPFDLHSTGTAVWHHYLFGKQKIPSRFYDNADVTEDAIVENFNLELHAKNTTAYLRVKKALRRYVEEDRIVIVFRTVFNPVELDDEPMSGVCFRNSGYIVVKRPKTIPGTFSLLQMFYEYTPIVGNDHPKVGAMTEFMMRATEANFASSHQLIENVLLAQAMNKLGA
ncbi:hypothetical protein FI667_g11747, partial [Globisporangium splendens]